jgi:hypothetical protein
MAQMIEFPGEPLIHDDLAAAFAGELGLLEVGDLRGLDFRNTGTHKEDYREDYCHYRANQPYPKAS